MSAGSSVDNSKNWSGKTGRHSSSGVGHVYHARSVYVKALGLQPKIVQISFQPYFLLFSCTFFQLPFTISYPLTRLGKQKLFGAHSNLSVDPFPDLVNYFVTPC